MLFIAMRYLRQEILREIGKNGQSRLHNSVVAVIGLGALGSVSAELLTRAGIGKLIIIDRDFVELSNLQRQSVYGENDVGKPKAVQAAKHLGRINSEVRIDFYFEDLDFENIGRILPEKPDLILDCTDNLTTRFLINDYAIKNNIPFIYSAAIGTKGYVFSIIPHRSACLRCFLKTSL
jgi:adenylyltransferase/sulfurtransferase